MLMGLDLGSRSTGWCCGAGAGNPEVGAWSIDAHGDDGAPDYGKMLAQLEDYLHTAHLRFGFTTVAYEAPILVTSRFVKDGETRYGDNLNKLRLLYPLGAFVEWFCHRRGIDCFEVTIQAIKKEVTGNHLAVKDDMVAIAQKVGLDLPRNKTAEDAADAFGAWLLLLRAFDKTASAEWDRRIWTPKGALL